MTELPPPGTSLALDNDVFNDWRYQRTSVVKSIRNYQMDFKVFPALTSFTVFEALLGIERQIAKVRTPSEVQLHARVQLNRLVANCTVLSFDAMAAEIAAYVFSRLGRAKGNRLDKDVYIASTAISHRYGLVSRNKRDYDVISSILPPGKKLYLTSWQD